MSNVTPRDLARHARLFELLRQQNIARETRKRLQAKANPTLSDSQRFKQMAERSLSDGQARPDRPTPS